MKISVLCSLSLDLEEEGCMSPIVAIANTLARKMILDQVSIGHVTELVLQIRTFTNGIDSRLQVGLDRWVVVGLHPHLRTPAGVAHLNQLTENEKLVLRSYNLRRSYRNGTGLASSCKLLKHDIVCTTSTSS